MTDQPPKKPTPKDNVLATFAAIQRLLGDDQMPAAVKLVQCEALAIYGAVELEKIAELKRRRGTRKKVTA